MHCSSRFNAVYLLGARCHHFDDASTEAFLCRFAGWRHHRKGYRSGIRLWLDAGSRVWETGSVRILRACIGVKGCLASRRPASLYPSVSSRCHSRYSSQGHAIAYTYLDCKLAMSWIVRTPEEAKQKDKRITADRSAVLLCDFCHCDTIRGTEWE
jgi:hypothetical protein